MEILQQAHKLIVDLMSIKLVNGEYKASKFNVLKQIGKKNLLLNTLTREVISLNDNELSEYNKLKYTYTEGSSEFIKSLITKGFIVESSVNEVLRYKQVLSLYRIIGQPQPAKIVQYKIFTTTFCNARCFYCFEEGMTYDHMTIETAENVVQYILKTCVDGTIILYWFGGEPLCNVSVIDYICKRLREENKQYVSKIITNGYLFDDKLIEKAKEDWNLIFAQITLDGTEEEHNKRKAYVKPKENPFNKTLGNIHKLLDKDIYVALRLNFDENNLYCIYDLINMLSDEFNNNEKLRVYPAILSTNWFNQQSDRTENNEERLREEFINIFNKLRELKLYNVNTLDTKTRAYFCMASNPIAATISAKGELFTCQSCDENMIFGDVINGVTKPKIKSTWENSMDTWVKCNNCPFLPECAPFDKCPTSKSHCRVDKDFVITKQLENLANNEKGFAEKD